MYDLSIPQRIADRRKRRKLAGYQLAKKAGISPSYLSLIERGHKLPSVEVAVRIARALGDREELYRAWVETADVEDEQDLDRRIDSLTTLRRTRSLPAFPHQPPSPSMRTEEAPEMSD